MSPTFAKSISRKKSRRWRPPFCRICSRDFHPACLSIKKAGSSKQTERERERMEQKARRNNGRKPPFCFLLKKFGNFVKTLRLSRRQESQPRRDADTFFPRYFQKIFSSLYFFLLFSRAQYTSLSFTNDRNSFFPPLPLRHSSTRQRTVRAKSLSKQFITKHQLSTDSKTTGFETRSFLALQLSGTSAPSNPDLFDPSTEITVFVHLAPQFRKRVRRGRFDRERKRESEMIRSKGNTFNESLK